MRATGEPLDVLYLGFLAPVMLPQRLAPFPAQPCLVAVRDSKNPEGPAFTVSPAAFSAFVRGL
ncbi:DUF397 domain-containing protein [Streptomyces sp. NPDC001193]